MSMHNVPLTKLEKEGLKRHHLKIGEPSQLSDAFRLGMAWALNNSNVVPVDIKVYTIDGNCYMKCVDIFGEKDA